MHPARRSASPDRRRDPQVRAAGGVVWRWRHADRELATVEVLLVHRPRYDDWSFPKGKLDAGETDEQAALREVEEETGVQCALGDELPSIRYIDGKGRDKVVRYWAMEPIGESPWRPGDEVDARRWLPVTEARHVLTYDHDHDVLAALSPPSPAR